MQMKGFEKDFVRSAFINLAFAQLYASNCKKVVKVDDKWVESCLPKWVKDISDRNLYKVSKRADALTLSHWDYNETYIVDTQNYDTTKNEY